MRLKVDDESRVWALSETLFSTTDLAEMFKFYSDAIPSKISRDESGSVEATFLQKVDAIMCRAKMNGIKINDAIVSAEYATVDNKILFPFEGSNWIQIEGIDELVQTRNVRNHCRSLGLDVTKIRDICGLGGYEGDFVPSVDIECDSRKSAIEFCAKLKMTKLMGNVIWADYRHVPTNAGERSRIVQEGDAAMVGYGDMNRMRTKQYINRNLRSLQKSNPGLRDKKWKKKPKMKKENKSYHRPPAKNEDDTVWR